MGGGGGPRALKSHQYGNRNSGLPRKRGPSIHILAELRASLDMLWPCFAAIFNVKVGLGCMCMVFMQMQKHG
jgi:hypothetical protein